MEFLKNEVAKKARLAYIRGLVYGVGGNISVRREGRIWITPERAALRAVRSEDIVVTDLAGDTVGKGKPSIELPMHRTIYLERPAVNAVVHTHSTFATVWSTTGEPLQSQTVEGRLVLGVIPVVRYADPGTASLARKVTENLEHKQAVLLQNHGVITVGSSLDEAFNLAETVEETAKIEVLTDILRRAVPKNRTTNNF